MKPAAVIATFAPGTPIVVFGKRPATVVALHGGGRKVAVKYGTGSTGFVKASECKEAAA